MLARTKTNITAAKTQTGNNSHKRENRGNKARVCLSAFKIPSGAAHAVPTAPGLPDGLSRV